MKQSILLISIFISSFAFAQEPAKTLDQHKSSEFGRSFFDDFSVGISLNHSLLRGDASGLSDQFLNEGLTGDFKRGDIIDMGFGIRVSKQINRFFDIGLEIDLGSMTGGKDVTTYLASDQRHSEVDYSNFTLATRFYFSKLFAAKIRRPIVLGYLELGGGILNYDAKAYKSYEEVDNAPWATEGTAYNLGVGAGVEVRVFKKLSVDFGTRYNFTNSDEVDAINEDIRESEFNDGYWITHLGANLDLSKKTPNSISHKWHFGELNFDGDDLREIEDDNNSSDNSKSYPDTVYVHTTDTMIIHSLDTVVSELKNIIVNNNIKSNNRTVRFSPVYFATDSYLIRQEQVKAIEKVAFYLLDNEDVNITLNGHADKRGSSEHNRLLSKRRVEAVQKVLVNVYEIDPSRIQANYYGEENLKIDQDDINRRVDFNVR